MRYVAALLVLAGLAWLFWPVPERDRAEAQRDPVAPKTTPDREEPAPAAPRPTRWHVLYLGPGDRPLVGVPVVAYPSGPKGEAAAPVLTGLDGRATLEGPPDAKQLRIGDPYRSYFGTLDEASTTFRITSVRPLEVAFVERATGRAVDVARVVLRNRHAELPLSAGGLEFAPLKAHVKEHDLHLVPELPDGWTTEHGLTFPLNGPFSVAAKRVRAVITLWPEFRLTVRAVRDGKPLAGATMARVQDGDLEPLAITATTSGADGRIDVRGIPRIPGLELFVKVAAGDIEVNDFVTIKGEAGEAVIDLSEPDDSELPFKEWKSVIGVGGGGGGEPVGATLRVRVLHRDGRPAAGARLTLARWEPVLPPPRRYCNADGVARFEDLPPKTYTVYLTEPGLVPSTIEVPVAAQGTHEVTLQEPPGRTIQVLTVDAAGQLVPFVRLDISQIESKVPYVRVVDGTQIVPLMTGADGRVVLDGLGHESIAIQSRVGGDQVDSATIDVDDEPVARLTVR